MEVPDLDEEVSDLDEEVSGLEMNDSNFEMEEAELEFDDADLEMEPSELDMDEDELEIEDSSDLTMDGGDLEIDNDELKIDDDELEIEESALKIEGIDLEPASESDQSDSDLDMGDDLSFEESEFKIDDDDDPDGIEFVALEDDEPVSMEDEKESAFEMEEQSSEDEEEFELEFDVEEDTDDTQEQDTSFEVEPDQDKPFIALDEERTEDVEQEAEDAPAITSEDDFSEYDEVLNQDTEPEDDGTLEEETIAIEEIEDNAKVQQEEEHPKLIPASGSRRRKKKTGLGTPVLLLLLICLLVVGAYIASIMTGYKIPYISDIQIPFMEQYLKKPASEVSDTKPIPDQKSVNGRFVTNSTTGTLFVITGRVVNPSNIAYKHIQISGALITEGKKEAKTKTAYCGNIISEDMLKTGNIADINKILAIKTGNNNLNTNVKSKTNIPFMIVFSELPEKLQNFTVKVIAFEKVKAN